VLDWIMQVAKKSWADDEILASLVQALGYVLRPQATLCRLGKEQMLSLNELRQLLVTAETEANSED
jgi:PleD family two-component response regulator